VQPWRQNAVFNGETKAVSGFLRGCAHYLGKYVLSAGGWRHAHVRWHVFERGIVLRAAAKRACDREGSERV